eukprot:6946629-Karenia_brevis.AAC.1
MEVSAALMPQRRCVETVLPEHVAQLESPVPPEQPKRPRSASGERLRHTTHALAPTPKQARESASNSPSPTSVPRRADVDPLLP